MQLETRQLFAIGLGVVGGAAIGKMAFEHLFVVGLDDQERRGLVSFGAGALVVLAGMSLLGIGKEWVDPMEAAKRVEGMVAK